MRSVLARLSVAVLLLSTGFLAACTDDDSAPSRRVDAPVAGAAVGGTTNVRWSGLGGDTVSIDLSDDGGSTYATNVVSGTQNDGLFALDTTSFTDGATYRIRVRGNNGNAESGIFSIDNTAPVIVLDSPNGGGFIGLASSIQWTTTDANPGTVEIRASDDSGATYGIVIAAAAPDTGTFAWNATMLPEGTTYRVQVTPTDAAGNAGASDASDGDFTLDLTPPTVTLTAPNGGESLSGIETATWNTTDANPGTVILRASTDSGANYSELITDDAPDTGSFEWRTGLIEDTTTGRLQIVAIDQAGNMSAPDASDADFSATNLRLIDVAHYGDANGTGTVDQGDTLLLRFDKDVTVNGAAPTDVALAVAGDALGAGATVALGIEPETILVILGTNPLLRHRGEFQPADLDPNSPSGIDVSATMTPDAIESAIGGIDASATVAVDIRPRPVGLMPFAGTATIARRGAVADLDGDGDLDLVIAITGGNPSQVWLNDGNFGWTLAQSFGTDDTRAVALGDVDGDGDIDVVTANVGPNRVWLNDGTGQLTDSAQGLAASATQGVALGDLDGDGDLDIYFANGGVAGMPDTVWFNDGNGAFANSAQALGGSNSSAVALGDMDGDGDLDAFVAHNGDSASTLYANNGAGIFSVHTTTLQTAAQDVDLGDFDNDGDLDVWISALGQNQVHLNQGDGTFGSSLRFYGNNDNRGAVLIDLDGDGDLDVMNVKNLDSGRYWINQGDGTFVEDLVRSLSDIAADVVAGRFDADADVDFIVINENGEHRPYRNSSSGGQPLADLDARALDTPPTQGASVATGDIDGDGDMDVLVADAAGATVVMLSDRDGTFTLGTPFGLASRGGELFDADGDGDLDYLQRVGDPGAEADRLWINDGSGVFTDSGQALGVDAWVAGDLDSDGDVDLVVDDGTDLRVFTNDGTGTFTDAGTILAATGFLQVSSTDADMDGDLDLIATDGSSLFYAFNNGLGVFSTVVEQVSQNVETFVLGDLDRDGDVDLLAPVVGASDMRFYGNPGTATGWSPSSATNDQTDFAELHLVDLDEDGALDLIAVDRGGELVARFFGQGDGTFGAASVIFVNAIGGAGVLDVELDGDPDVYVATGGGTTPAATADALLVLE